MSKKKRVVCIEKPSNECSVNNITVGKKYKILKDEDESYYIKDDEDCSFWYFKSYFKDAKPKKQKGLTKREEIAAKAMQGLLAASATSFSVVSQHAVFLADDLIEELNKKKHND